MYRLLFLLLFSSVSAFGQNNADSIHTRIDNVKTAKHVRIPGTRLYIVPPADYAVTTIPGGLQKGDEATMTMSDMIGGNYYTNVAAYGFDAFSKRGALILDSALITIDGYPARYAHMLTPAGVKLYAVYFGDSTFCTNVMAQSVSSASEKEAVAAINSIAYDKVVKVDPFETAAFSIDARSSPFKYKVSMMSGMYAFMIDTLEPGHKDDYSMLMVAQSLADKSLTLEMQIDLSLAELRNHDWTDFETTEAEAKTINGNKAFEKVVEARTKDGKRVQMYYLIETNNEIFVMMTGMVTQDYEENFKEIKRLAYSLKFK